LNFIWFQMISFEISVMKDLVLIHLLKNKESLENMFI